MYARLHPKTQDIANADSSDEEKSPKPLGFPKNKKIFSSVGRGKLVNKKPPEGKKVDRKNLKKNHKRRSGLKTESSKSFDSDKSVKSEPPIKKLSPRKNVRRKSTTDAESEEDGPSDPTSLRSWIDTYEEAVTNHYSPELRKRLQVIHLFGNVETSLSS